MTIREFGEDVQMSCVAIGEKLATLRTTSHVKTRRRLTLACIVAVAVSLDLHKLDSQPFWLDECVTDMVANSHGLRFVKLAFARYAAMAFYNLTLHGWLMLVPPSDFNIRLLSTVFAVGAVAALYVLARKLFGTAIGLAAAALLAVNPFFLSYAQEARSYTLTVLFTLVSWSSFIESFRQPKLLNLAAYTAATTLAIYSHNLAILILPAQCVAIFFVRSETRIAPIRVASALCATFVLVLPLFPIAAHFYSGDADWIAAGGHPGLRSLRDVAICFAGGIAPPRATQELLEVLFAAGVLMYLERFVTAVHRGSTEVGSYALVATAFGLPIALLIALSQVFDLFTVRYVLICLPFLVVMIAVGWVKCSRRWVTAVGLTLLLLLSLSADRSYYSNPSKPDWRAAVNYITDSARRGDKVAFVPSYGRVQFDHSLKRFVKGGTRLTIIYPRLDAAGNYMDSSALMRVALNAPYERLWVVWSHNTGDRLHGAEALNGLTSKYPVVFRKEFRGVSVIFCGYPF